MDTNLKAHAWLVIGSLDRPPPLGASNTHVCSSCRERSTGVNPPNFIGLYDVAMAAERNVAAKKTVENLISAVTQFAFCTHST